MSGSYRGTAGLHQFTASTAAIAPGGARTEVLECSRTSNRGSGADLVATAGSSADRCAAVCGVSRATRPGHRALRNEAIHLITVDGGKATAITIYNRDQRTVDAFWS